MDKLYLSVTNIEDALAIIAHSCYSQEEKASACTFINTYLRRCVFNSAVAPIEKVPTSEYNRGYKDGKLKVLINIQAAINGLM